MLDYKENDILTTDQLIKMDNENINYKNNKYLKYLVTNQIISGISYKNFKKIWCYYIMILMIQR